LVCTIFHERALNLFLLLTNGRVTLTGEFTAVPTKERQTKAIRSMKPEEPMSPMCVFNCTLPNKITRGMMPHSTKFFFMITDQ
jgi:hypothetical protein